MLNKLTDKGGLARHPNLHMTISYLPKVPDHQVEMVKQAIQEALAQYFGGLIGDVGYRKNITINLAEKYVIVSIEKNQHLLHLIDLINRTLASKGLAQYVAKRDYHKLHVTIGYLADQYAKSLEGKKRAITELKSDLEKGMPQSKPFPIDKIVLFESVGRGIYNVLEEYSLFSDAILINRDHEQYPWLSGTFLQAFQYKGTEYQSINDCFHKQMAKIDKAHVGNLDSSRIGLSLAITYNRFKQNPDLAQALIETYPKIIINDSTHPFWGIGAGSGANSFGKILMHVRTLLLNENQYLQGQLGKEIAPPVIMQINSLDEIATMLGVLPWPQQQTLFAFDIDHTLLRWGKGKIIDLVEEGKDWKDHSRFFVEHIQQFVPAIALTNSFVESDRGAHLNLWKISFVGAASRLNLPANLTITFDSLKQTFGQVTQTPVFSDGILITGQFLDSAKKKVYGITKGQLLGAFIDFVYQQTKWLPTYVYMVDDVFSGVESIAEAMSARGILFYGFWYGKLGYFPSYRGGAYFMPGLVK